MKIQYSVPFINQGVIECVQSSGAELLQYLGIHKTLEDVKKEVPIYIKRGDSYWHIVRSFGDVFTYFWMRSYTLCCRCRNI